HLPERPKIPNLDVNPIPDYRLITGWKPGGVISVATSRGCPFSCTFCSVPGMYGHAFRTHSVERVLQELESHRGNMYTFFANDIDSIQFMILTPIPGSPDWEQVYDRGDKYVISKNWQFYDGHHAVHQPRRMSPYELQMSALNAMAKFYSWRGIAKKLLKGDKYYAAIRFFGKRMIRDWWKDSENRQHVDWLRTQLYGDAKEL